MKNNSIKDYRIHTDNCFVNVINGVIIKIVLIFLFTEIMAPQVEEGSIRVEDKIYSAEKLSQLHPGGPLFIKVGFPFKCCTVIQ
jgi:hypothetical protein